MPTEPEQAHESFLFENGTLSPCARNLVTEQPLTILLNDRPLVTLMRTPGDEEELALGYLLTEGLVRSPKDVGAITFCPEGRNKVLVHLASGVEAPSPLPSHRRVFSSCGICGAEAIEEVARDLPRFALSPGRLAPGDIFALAEAMRRGQERFRRTGGTHAAALARPPVTSEVEAIVREDIGRHNALDKAVGVAARREWGFEGLLLLLSGRLSFEMVAKAARAGICDVAGVSAPSAPAVQLAERLNMFLAGFVRGNTMTVYAGRDALKA